MRITRLLLFVLLAVTLQGCAKAPSSSVMNAYQANNFAAPSTQNIQFWANYARLNHNEQQLYKRILQAILNVEPSVTFQGKIDDATYKRIFNSVYYDHPELFWITDGFKCDITTHGNGTTDAIMYFDYTSVAWDLDDKIARFEAEAEKILSVARTLDSVEEKELYVHDQLVMNTEYKKGSAHNQSAYSALVNHESVCNGYARAFQFLMNRLGIPTMVVPGKYRTGHAWNIINIRGNYYNVDVTNDVVESKDKDGKLIRLPVYTLFNRTDSEFAAKGFVRQSSYSQEIARLPECTATESAIENHVDEMFSAYSRVLPLSRQHLIRNRAEFNLMMKTELKRQRSSGTVHISAIVIGAALLDQLKQISDTQAHQSYIAEAIAGTKLRYQRSYTATAELANGIFIYQQHGVFE